MAMVLAPDMVNEAASRLSGGALGEGDPSDQLRAFVAPEYQSEIGGTDPLALALGVGAGGSTAAQQQLAQGNLTAQQMIAGMGSGMAGGAAPGAARRMAAGTGFQFGQQSGQQEALLQAQEQTFAQDQALQALMGRQMWQDRARMAELESEQQIRAAKMAQDAAEIQAIMGAGITAAATYFGGPMGGAMAQQTTGGGQQGGASPGVAALQGGGGQGAIGPSTQGQMGMPFYEVPRSSGGALGY